MMPSRPNGVLNHGTPANTYEPVGRSLVIIWTSAADRLHHSLNCSFAVNTWHHACRLAEALAAASSPASSYERVGPWPSGPSQAIVTVRVPTCCGASST
jgi:hypothetical protein